jgi:hypothetical protein
MGGGTDGGGNRRADAWRKIHRTCPCGREVFGNGKAHQRSCEAHLSAYGWPLDDGMADAVRRECAPGAVTYVQARLGEMYLERRHSGKVAPLSWAEYRDAVWRFADEFAMQATQ